MPFQGIGRYLCSDRGSISPGSSNLNARVSPIVADASLFKMRHHGRPDSLSTTDYFHTASSPFISNRFHSSQLSHSPFQTGCFLFVLPEPCLHAVSPHTRSHAGVWRSFPPKLLLLPTVELMFILLKCTLFCQHASPYLHVSFRRRKHHIVKASCFVTSLLSVDEHKHFAI